MPYPQQHSFLSSNDVIGMMIQAYEGKVGATITSAICMKTVSDKDSETYKWLGSSPSMREWIGSRLAAGLAENSFTIKNKDFESTLEVSTKDLRRDKKGNLKVRLEEMALNAAEHSDELLADLINGGAAGVCYDGQYFYDTDHSEGDSGAQCNKISVDISALATQVHGSVSAPAVEEMALAVLQGIQQLYSLKDDKGKPRNGSAKQFLLHVPVGYMAVAMAAVSDKFTASGNVNPLASMNNFSVTVQVDQRLTGSDKFFIHIVDHPLKPFIFQEEQPIQYKAIAEGSELEFNNKVHHYGYDACHNVGYGMWHKSIQVTLA